MLILAATAGFPRLQPHLHSGEALATLAIAHPHPYGIQESATAIDSGVAAV